MSKPQKKKKSAKKGVVQKSPAQKIKTSASKSAKKVKKKIVELTPIGKIMDKRIAFVMTFALLLLVGGFSYWKYLSHKEAFVFEDIGSDTLTIFYPQMLHGKQFKKKDKPVTYSFYKGMGKNSYSKGGMKDLFGMLKLQKLIKGVKGGPAFKVVWNMFFRVIATGLVIFFLLRAYNLRSEIAAIGALSFAFSGFLILGSTWYGHANTVFYFSLAILGLELIISKKMWWLFPIPLIYMMGPYMYFLTEFFILYGVIRAIDVHDFKLKKILSIALIALMAGMIAIPLAAPKLGSKIEKLRNSPRVGGKVSYENIYKSQPVFKLANAEHNGAAILRSFSPNMLGAGDQYEGWRNYLESPTFYCGLLVLLLIPQFFFLASKKRRLLFGIFLGVWLLTIAFPYFRYAFYKFVGDYYKNGLATFIPITFLIIGMLGLGYMAKGRRANLPLLGATLLLFLGLLYFPNATVAPNVDPHLRMVVTGFLVIYSGIIAAMNRVKFNKVLLLSLLAITVLEVGYMARHTLYNRQSIPEEDWNQRKRHNDYSIEAVEFVNEQKNEPFFRVDKTFGSVKSGYNDGMAQGFMGTKSYNSFNNKHVVRFLDELGVIDGSKEYNTRWLIGVAYTTILQPLVSVKYLLSTPKTVSRMDYDMYSFKQKFNNVEVNQSKYYLEMGIPYAKYIKRSDLKTLDVNQRQRILYEAIVLEDRDVKKFPFMKPIDSKKPRSKNATLKKIKNLQKRDMDVTFFNHKEIRGKIDMKKKGLVFYSIPFGGGWKAYVDQKETKIHPGHIGFMAIEVPEGKHNIKFEFTPPSSKAGIQAMNIGLIIYFLLLLLTFGKVQKPRIPTIQRIKEQFGNKEVQRV